MDNETRFAVARRCIVKLFFVGVVVLTLLLSVWQYLSAIGTRIKYPIAEELHFYEPLLSTHYIPAYFIDEVNATLIRTKPLSRFERWLWQKRISRCRETLKKKLKEVELQRMMNAND